MKLTDTYIRFFQRLADKLSKRLEVIKPLSEKQKKSLHRVKRRKQMNKQKEWIAHGEVGLFEVPALPATVKKKDLKETELYDGQYKVAASEVRGNHHLVKLGEGVGIYEDTDGTIYIVNERPTTVSCVDTRRHDEIELPPSVWVRKPAKETDHLRQIKRNVAD